MRLLLVFLSVSGEARPVIIPPEETDRNSSPVCWTEAATVRRQADQGPGQFDLFGQVLSSFRKFYRIY